MRSWSELSMAEKADIMKLAIDGGVYDLDSIRSGYNEYAKGGKKNQDTWTMEDETKYREWRSSLPANLRNTDDNLYDMRGAYKAEMKPTLESDGRYHLQSRDPKTGRILKSPLHPTYLQAIATDANMGYYPVVDNQGNTYTQTWEGNQFKSGGSIHIKPSHRGRLTELKARTGKSEAELYNDGNPAHKKMVVFARNARKWKHGLGGNLFSGEEEGSQKMQIGLKATNGWKPYTLDDILANAARIEQQKQAMEDRFNNDLVLSNDATSVANGRLQNRHLERKAVEGAKAHAAWAKDNPTLDAVGMGLGTVPFVIASAPATVLAGDALAGSALGKVVTAGLTNPYFDALMTSAGGAHAAHSIANNEADWITALELVPMARLGMPVYNAAKSTYNSVKQPITSWAKAEGDFSSPFKTGSSDPFTKYLYGRKIAGKSMMPGEDIGFTPDVIKGLPAEAQEYLMHNTVERQIKFLIDSGVDPAEAQKYATRAKGLMEDVNVGKYTMRDYEKAGMADSGGFYDNEGNFISINTESGFPEHYVAKHEGRHLLDYKLDNEFGKQNGEFIWGSDFDADQANLAIRNAFKEQEKILSDAFDSDFISIPESEYAGSLKGYTNMDKERITTNRDARDVLLGDTYSKWDTEMQNKIIDKTSDDKIFDAVERSNGYGKRYIRLLRDQNKLTPEKAQKFRTSMKRLGAWVAPTAIGVGTAYGASQNQQAYGGLLEMANMWAQHKK